MMPFSACNAALFARGLFVRSQCLWQVERRTLCSSATQEHLHKYHVTATTAPSNKSGAVVQTSTGHTLQTDVPKGMGGKDSAPQPVETLLAALAGCTQATALFVSRQMKPRVTISYLEMEFKAERDVRGALGVPIEQDPLQQSRLAKVEGRVVVHATESLSPEQLVLLQHQTELRCPVASMLAASGCDMTGVLWVDGSSAQV